MLLMVSTSETQLSSNWGWEEFRCPSSWRMDLAQLSNLVLCPRNRPHKNHRHVQSLLTVSRAVRWRIRRQAKRRATPHIRIEFWPRLGIYSLLRLEKTSCMRHEYCWRYRPKGSSSSKVDDDSGLNCDVHTAGWYRQSAVRIRGNLLVCLRLATYRRRRTNTSWLESSRSHVKLHFSVRSISPPF